jgi:hypothetical protein
MTATGRRLRLAAVAIVLVLVAWGSVRGADHDFPFGPFRMYATSGRPNGAVRTAALEAVVDGQVRPFPSASLGLRRSELEGQFDRFRADPRLLEALAGFYEEREGVELDELRLVERIRRLRNRERVGPTETEVLATWVREP